LASSICRNEENGTKKVFIGSHKKDIFNYYINKAKNLALNQEVSHDQFNHSDIVSLNLKAGQILLYDDGLLHGSEANNSDRRRCGITLRDSPVDIKTDLLVWLHFETQLVIGKDVFQHNPIAQIPKDEATPNQKFQHSSEFKNLW